MLGFVFVLLFSRCGALKSLYGEIYGEDDGGDGEGGFGGTRSVSVSFDGVMVDGNGTTPLVSLVFGRDIDGLLDRDVTVASEASLPAAVPGESAQAGSPI
jgi:hypothetical protein